MQREGGDTGAASFIGGEIGQELVGGFRSFGEDELEVMTEGGFDGGDVWVGDPNFVGQRAEDLVAVVQGGEGAGAEAFVFGLELIEDIQAGTFLGLLAQEVVELAGALLDLLLDLAQTLLAFLDRRLTSAA